MSARGWQRAEGGLVFLAAMVVAMQLVPGGWPLWAWPLALLAPDLAMAGYLAGPRAGAATGATATAAGAAIGRMLMTSGSMMTLARGRGSGASCKVSRVPP